MASTRCGGKSISSPSNYTFAVRALLIPNQRKQKSNSKITCDANLVLRTLQHTHGRYSPVSSAENEHLLVPRVHDRPCRRVGIRYVNLDACLGVAGKICFDPVLCSALLPSLPVHCFCRTAPAGARFSGIARASPLSMAKNIGKKVRFVDNDAGGICIRVRVCLRRAGGFWHSAC